MPIVVLVGGLVALLAECLYERYLERRGSLKSGLRP
jgi:hypothetical protein